LGRAALLVGVGLLVLGIGACARPRVVTTVPAGRTVESVVAEIGPAARARWAPHFLYARLEYPPWELALVAFKRERRLEIWGRQEGPWVRIDVYPILAASGGPGPKLREGDGQVPEGLYRVVALNPNSRFHLSMMLDYPNAYDVAEAEKAGRVDLGGEIFLHGRVVSIGCLAMGDRAIENLFVLVADVGLEHVQIVIAPRDPRQGVALQPVPGLPFTRELYQRITAALQPFATPLPPAGG
jgi:hypothetical protein